MCYRLSTVGSFDSKKAAADNRYQESAKNTGAIFNHLANFVLGHDINMV